jgi:hypothetical protein
MGKTMAAIVAMDFIFIVFVFVKSLARDWDEDDFLAGVRNTE